MSRIAAFAVALAFSMTLPLSAAQQDKDKKPEKPPPHVLLQTDLLQEQQTLQRLQTVWLLQFLKTKQQLDKQDTELARQEAAACAKLLEGARELPTLFDTAGTRLKRAALLNLGDIKAALKASQTLTDALQRMTEGLQKAPPEVFGAERSLVPKDAVSFFALLEVSEELDRAVHALAGVETAIDPMSAWKSSRQSVEKCMNACRTALKYRKLLHEKASDNATVVITAKSLTILAALLDENGPFARFEALPGNDTNSMRELAAKARAGLRELAAACELLEPMTVRLVVVGGIHELAQRQRTLRARLKTQHDEVLGNLLEGIAK